MSTRISAKESFKVVVRQEDVHIYFKTRATCMTKKAKAAINKEIWLVGLVWGPKPVHLFIDATKHLKRCELTVHADTLVIRQACALTQLKVGGFRRVYLYDPNSLVSVISMDNQMTFLDVEPRCSKFPTWRKVCARRGLQLSGDLSRLTKLNLSRLRLAEDFVWPQNVARVELFMVHCPQDLDFTHSDLLGLTVSHCHEVRTIRLNQCSAMTISENSRLRELHTANSIQRSWYFIRDCFRLQQRELYPCFELPCWTWSWHLRELCIIQSYVRNRKLRRFVKLIKSEQFNKFMFQPDQLGGRLAKRALEQQMDCSL